MIRWDLAARIFLEFEGESGIYAYEGVMTFAFDTRKRTYANLRVFSVSPDFAHDFEM